MDHTNTRHAVVFRMVMDKHICPFGLKSLNLLRRHGLSVDDHPLTSRQQTDDFMREHDVSTTPQIFIEGRRIGGYDDLRSFFGLDGPGTKDVSYRPVIAVFAVAGLMALLSVLSSSHSLDLIRLKERFASITMCILAILKLQDLEAFSTMFLGYDLLARRWVPYAYLYPFGEALSGLLMFGGFLPWISGPIAFFIGSIGCVSVFYAVYVQKRRLNCACVGGGSRVPLGFVSLAENMLMLGMGTWMLVGALSGGL